MWESAPTLGTTVATVLDASSLCLLLLTVVVAVATHSKSSFLHYCRPFEMHPLSISIFLRTSAAAGVLNTLMRAQHIRAFYTDEGVFPNKVYNLVCSTIGACDFDFNGSEIETYMDHSLHLMSGNYGVQCLLFGLTIWIGTLATIKPKSGRLLAAYIMVSSMHRRNHWINNKGDETLRAMLLWSALLSLEMEQKLVEGENVKQSTRHNVPLVSTAGVGYLLQVSILYWFSAMYKYADREQNAWRDGSAMRQALSMVLYRTFTGNMILSLPPLVGELLTHISGLLECVGPFLLFSPFQTEVSRSIGVTLFIAFHIGIGTTMRLGMFPLYSCLVFTPFVPYTWWPAWARTNLFWCPSRADAVNYKTFFASFWRSWHRGGTVLTSVLIVWWQIHHFHRAKIPMPTFAKEICALIGLKQHWKVFTRLYELEPNCVPFVVGAFEGPSKFLYHSEVKMAQRGSESSEVNFVDLMKWRNAGGPLTYGIEAAEEEAILLPFVGASSERSLVDSELENIYIHSRPSSTLGSSHLWRQWVGTTMSIDMNVVGTGQYFCKQWNRMRLLSLRVLVDDKNATLVFSADQDLVVEAAKTFCIKHNIQAKECRRLFEAANDIAKSQRLGSYSLFNVCLPDTLSAKGARVSGQTRRCEDEDLTSSPRERIDLKLI